MRAIQIISGTAGLFSNHQAVPEQSAKRRGDSLKIVFADGSHRWYGLQVAIEKLTIVSEHGGNVLFDLQMRDGALFRAEAEKSIVEKLSTFVGRNASVTSPKAAFFITGLIVLGIPLLLLARCATQPPSQEELARHIERDRSHIGGAAAIYCQGLVKNMLKSPASAKFPWAERAGTVNGVYYGYESYVDSQNSFGAMLRTHYFCDLKYDPSTENFTVQNLKIQR